MKEMHAISPKSKEAHFNKELIKNRFGSATNTYVANAIVQKEMAVSLVQMASQHIDLAQKQMFEVGSGTGLLTQEILRSFSVEELICNDLVAEVKSYIQCIVQNYPLQHYGFVAGDAEQIAFPKAQDVIWSGATIQWIQHLDQFFSKLSDSLCEQGYFLVSSFGPDNYHEIKTSTGKGIEYKSVEQVLVAASSNFELVDKKEWHRTLWFKSPVEVLKHMRLTGVNGVSPCQWTKGDLKQFKDKYKQFAQLEGYPLTYHPFMMVLRKR